MIITLLSQRMVYIWGHSPEKSGMHHCIENVVSAYVAEGTSICSVFLCSSVFVMNPKEFKRLEEAEPPKPIFATIF